MDIKTIDYILEVAKTKNFNRAAENLFISQPTLSYHIKATEKEVGFQIFDRSGKGTHLTPAGEQFCVALHNIWSEWKMAVEQAKNVGNQYQDTIKIGLPLRAAILQLPKVMELFSAKQPNISITPMYSYEHSLERFIQHESDIVFAIEETVRKTADIEIHPFFVSHICLITKPEDPLAQKDRIVTSDLAGRTLMVDSDSPYPLRAVQQRIISTGAVHYFNSDNHEATLTNVAANRGVCLAPDFLNDKNPEFAWIPFDCEEEIPCVLCTHREDKRETVYALVRLLQLSVSSTV
jgi:DNA-binding transcriptional LysR family regulator